MRILGSVTLTCVFALVFVPAAVIAAPDFQPATIKTGELKVVGGKLPPTPPPFVPVVVKTDALRVVGGKTMSVPGPFKPVSINTEALRVVGGKKN